MQAGLLKEWITAEREEVSRDAFGGETRRWAEAFRTRARIQLRQGDQSLAGREMAYTAVYTVTIRYRPGVERTLRLAWGGERYRILSVDRNRPEQSLVIRCELINE